MWLLFLVIESRCEVIDFGISREIVFVIGAEDLAGELLLQGPLAAFGFEPLRPVSSRFGVRTKVLP